MCFLPIRIIVLLGEHRKPLPTLRIALSFNLPFNAANRQDDTEFLTLNLSQSFNQTLNLLKFSVSAGVYRQIF
jgi:hypothetical protein